MIDAKAFGEELAGIVKAATAPLLARIEVLERTLAERPEPTAGKDGRDGKDGASVGLDDVLPVLQDQVRDFLEAIPAPQDGKDGRDGKDGASVGLDDVLPVLQDQVRDFLEAIPAPQDGKDGRDGADGKDGAPGERGEPGRDGLDVKDLFRADGGRLVAVMSDGTTKDLGVFVGKDGEPGRDGADGKDGSDGLGFEDMSFEFDEHGRVLAKFQRGDVVKSVRLPGIVDRGPYKSGESYEKGDAVSYGGSLWIAQDVTDEKPDGGNGWRLAVKKGRDARGS